MTVLRFPCPDALLRRVAAALKDHRPMRREPFAALERRLRHALKRLTPEQSKTWTILALWKPIGQPIDAGYDVLAEAVGLSVRTLRDVLPALERGRWLELTRGRSRGRGRGYTPMILRARLPVEWVGTKREAIGKPSGTQRQANGDPTGTEREANGKPPSLIPETGRQGDREGGDARVRAQGDTPTPPPMDSSRRGQPPEDSETWDDETARLWLTRRLRRLRLRCDDERLDQWIGVAISAGVRRGQWQAAATRIAWCADRLRRGDGSREHRGRCTEPSHCEGVLAAARAHFTAAGAA